MNTPPERETTSNTADFDTAWRDHHRYLTGLAARVVRDPAEAEDLVQEAFARLSRADLDDIDDVGGWLAVVVRRLALDRIRSAHHRRETVAGSSAWEHLESLTQRGGDDPGDRVALDDQVQEAMAIVLDRLTPAERTSFLLHEVFGFPFPAVAEIVGRTPAACRQLASRARRAIQVDAARGFDEPAIDERHVVTERFIAACTTGDLDALLAVLDPDVGGVATTLDGDRSLRFSGRSAVARQAIRIFGAGTHRILVPLPFDEHPCLLVLHDGRVHGAIRVTLSDDRRIVDLNAVLVQLGA